MKRVLPSVLNELDKFNLNITIVLEESDKDTIKSISNFNCKILFQKIKVMVMH